MSEPRPALPSLPQQLLAEFLGTAMLLCTVIGSGIMAERLSGGNSGVALLANTLATVAALFVLIETLGPISGAHFNPVVTIYKCISDHKWPYVQHSRYFVATYFIVFQLLGAVLGAALANAMFDLPWLHWSQKIRGATPAAGQWLAEAVATAGLLFVIARTTATQAAPSARGSALVASYIGAAYWFTSSTSFANPAAVMGRMFSDTFAGIAPASATAFVAAQLLGGALGVLCARMLGR